MGVLARAVAGEIRAVPVPYLQGDVMEIKESEALLRRQLRDDVAVVRQTVPLHLGEAVVGKGIVPHTRLAVREQHRLSLACSGLAHGCRHPLDTVVNDEVHSGEHGHGATQRVSSDKNLQLGAS